MRKYEELLAGHSKESVALRDRYNLISAIRLVLVIGFGFSIYFYSQTNNAILLLPLVLFAVGFFIAMKWHQKTSWKRQMEEALITINDNEIAFLKGEESPFENGEEFIDTTHSYSYDLDVFGKHSLFQTLNRTATYAGGEKLAASLLAVSQPNEIIEKQEAIRELQSKIEWRQEILALGKVRTDSSESYQKLMSWLQSSSAKVAGVLNIASYVLPVLTFLSLIIYFLTPMTIFGNIGLLLILFNLMLLATQVKKIMRENINSGEIDKILKQYSLIMKKIENEEFQSKKLKGLKGQLHFSSLKASKKIEQLSLLFAQMDHIQNAYAGPLFNGLVLFHIHVLRGLFKWRADCKDHVREWLGVIGEFEALNSFANLYYNNPDYSFPVLNDKRELSFEDLGHPMIGSESRINNNVTFNPQGFFILTGSNMSGKSTFLRTLGVNMILANTGAPICATSANIHPLPILVSMRLSDSLSDSESYFFAEVKRLKEIMDALDSKQCFVLLDEILRGTNSDDKRTGTIEVIRKMVAKNAIGAIATHDLEVCNTTEEYPETLINKRFEVEIVDDELSFDYKLRDGICQNKSATFLMEKMGVI